MNREIMKGIHLDLETWIIPGHSQQRDKPISPPPFLQVAQNATTVNKQQLRCSMHCPEAYSSIT